MICCPQSPLMSLVKNNKWGFRDTEYYILPKPQIKEKISVCYCFPVVAVATLLYLNNATSTAGAAATVLPQLRKQNKCLTQLDTFVKLRKEKCQNLN